MNERIKELIEQATTNESFYPAGCNGHHEDRYYFNKEKFAELIIKECADLDFRVRVGLSSDHDYEVSNTIKQHFGVE